MGDRDAIDAFIARWSGATGSERANHQLFVTELCSLLALPQPDPARDDTRDNACVFERVVTLIHGDGSQSLGFVDCYRRGAYVERLALPTVVEPLRAHWANAQAAALLLANEAGALDGKKRDDKLAEARAEIRRFRHQLCTTRVLDPACGSGNFLYDLLPAIPLPLRRHRPHARAHYPHP